MTAIQTAAVAPLKVYIAGKITGDPEHKRKFLAMIDSADMVAFLPDWEDSPGARLEHDYCEHVGKRLFHVADAYDN